MQHLKVVTDVEGGGHYLYKDRQNMKLKIGKNFFVGLALPFAVAFDVNDSLCIVVTTIL